VTDLLTTATARDERDRDAKVALLPIGSFEQHGDHMPLTTDTIVACAIANEIAKTEPVMLLPPVTISCSHEHAAWRGTVSISSQTLYRVVVDIADSVRASGVEHLVLINGHGGNYVLSNVVQEYTATHGPVMSLFPQGSDWTQARLRAGMETTSHDDMHAGELETSVLLFVAPETVLPGNETADWDATDRPLLLSHGMSAYTKTGVVGRPSLGAANKGRLLLEQLAELFGAHMSLVGRLG
jgi:creatinine amidohydrolase